MSEQHEFDIDALELGPAAPEPGVVDWAAAIMSRYGNDRSSDTVSQAVARWDDPETATDLELMVTANADTTTYRLSITPMLEHKPSEVLAYNLQKGTTSYKDGNGAVLDIVDSRNQQYLLDRLMTADIEQTLHGEPNDYETELAYWQIVGDYVIDGSDALRTLAKITPHIPDARLAELEELAARQMRSFNHPKEYIKGILIDGREYLPEDIIYDAIVRRLRTIREDW